jgi:flagellar basal body-associated protein FliL
MINNNPLLPQIQRYPIKKANYFWLDCGPRMKKFYIYTRLALGVLSLMTLIGTFVSVVSTNQLHSVAFSAIPMAAGTALTATFAAAGLSLFPAHNFLLNGLGKNLSGQQEHADLVRLLTNGSIKDLMYYRRKNGGLWSLLRNGYISIHQADAIRKLLEEYHQEQQLTEAYETNWILLQAINHRRFPETYYKAWKRKQEIDQEWRKIQEEIIHQYGVRKEPILTQRQAEPEVIPIFNITPPTLEAKKWSLDKHKHAKELVIKIIIISAVIIVLVGLVIGTYYLCTTPRHITTPTGKVTEKSNAYLSLVPLFVGLGLLFNLVFFYAINISLKQEGKENLKQPEVRDACILRLTEGTLRQVHAHYFATPNFYNRFEQLITCGVLTIVQGERLHDLLKKYDTITKALDAYQINQSDFTLTLQSDPTVSPTYAELLVKNNALNQEWLTFQSTLRDNFFGSDHVSSLIPELLEYTLDYLPVRDLGSAAQVNKTLHTAARGVLQRRMEEYRVDSLPFLKALFRNVSCLARRGYIPDGYLVHRSVQRFKIPDSEAILRKVHREGDESLRYKLGEALLYYVQQGKEGMVEAILHLNPYLETRDDSGFTPLMVAASAKNSKIVERLIARGADINALGYSGVTALYCAVYAKCEKNARLLLENGGGLSINQQLQIGGNTALHTAAFKNYKELVELLLEFGADKNITNAQNLTPADVTHNQKIRTLITNFEN